MNQDAIKKFFLKKRSMPIRWFTTERFKCGIKIFFIVNYFVLIFLPLIQMNLHVFSEMPVTENRVLTKFPVLDLKTADKFAEEFEKYFNDNFGFRTDLVHWSNKLRVKIMGIPFTNGVVIGRNEWLFLRNGMNIYTKEPLFYPPTLESETSFYQTKQAIAKSKGVVFIIVIAPNKDSIYPEYMHHNIKLITKETKLDQKLSYMRKNSKLDILDLRPALIESKNKYLVYYKTDTHWNKYGSFIAYQEIMKKIQVYFPEVPFMPYSDFSFQVAKTIGRRDLAKMLALPDEFADYDVNLTLKKNTKEIPKHKLPKLLVIYDSFMNPLFQFSGKRYFSLSFEDVSYVARAHSADPLDEELLNKENPNVVIYEISERLF